MDAETSEDMRKAILQYLETELSQRGYQILRRKTKKVWQYLPIGSRQHMYMCPYSNTVIRRDMSDGWG